MKGARDRDAFWLAKAALRWSRETPCSVYWDDENIATLTKLCCDSNQEAGIVEDSSEQSSGSLSYLALVVATVLASNSLRQRLAVALEMDSKVSRDLNECDLGVPIAVAIPEGPFLALAVLSVHVLNSPALVGFNAHAILVPLEPAEGKDRVKHMLKDSRPTFILCLSGSDWDKFEAILSEMEVTETLTSPEGIYQRTLPQLIDFKSLLEEAIGNFTKSPRQHLISRLRDHLSTTTKPLLDGVILDSAKLLLESTTTDYALQSEMYSGRLNRISHIVYTSGTTGIPKGCISSIQSLKQYLRAKNEAHNIDEHSTVLLASALSFDPCLSDILATFEANATLAIAPRQTLLQRFPALLNDLNVTHVLCTPTLWGMVPSGMSPADFPSLQVVALGGEPIPKRIQRTWARNSSDKQAHASSSLRLFSTYGVTEACVYQTLGEVTLPGEASAGQSVGKPMLGLYVEILEVQQELPKNEGGSTASQNHQDHPVVGEIVLCGSQIDHFSGYLNRPNLTVEKFIISRDSLAPNPTYSYRTGDAGFIDEATGNLYVLGRINADDGMIKVNGVRVELGEIEAALVDDDSAQASHVVVADCLAVARIVGGDSDNSSTQIHAYCVLADACLQEQGIQPGGDCNTALRCTASPLHSLLRARCKLRVKPGAVPTAFLVIPRIPMSPTGKRDRRKLPLLDECIPFGTNESNRNGKSILLRDYGRSGAVVAEQIISCLNLPAAQQSLLTTTADFGMIGGDSLSSTHVVRALYAYHHGVANSRLIGGQYGELEGPFAVSHLLRAKSLGDYADWLDHHGVCSRRESHETFDEENQPTIPKLADEESTEETVLYNGMMEAIIYGHTSVAMALLDIGVDPNHVDHGGRLSRTSGRMERKKKFKSSPLHLACSKGDTALVQKLIEKKCRLNSPDAVGSFPIHLAASGHSTEHGRDTSDDDMSRLECVRLLLNAGVPLAMKDVNKQTVLHCAARSGHCKLLAFLMQRWSEACDQNKIKVHDGKHRGGRFDWTDHWFRTPVHWAVLNGHIDSLKVLIKGGCSGNPPKPKSNRQTSVAIESPMEICLRLYKDNKEMFSAMSDILREE